MELLQHLCTYWAESLDWRSVEARLNELPQSSWLR
ncbi:epoxide hydrolase N-terminal domain-containing protein [Rahnella aceris]